jgi:predicted DNA-binding protein
MPTELRTEAVFDALKQPLALIESDERRRAIEAYIEAARTPLERAVFDLMSQLVQGVDERVGDHYRVRLAYRPGGLALEVEERVQNGEQEQWSALEGDVEKITIRIPAELKELATQAAARAGTSANTWFVKALARALRNIEVQSTPPPGWRHERRGRGSRLSGWVGGDE